MEVDVAYQSAQMVDRVVEAVRQILIDRHHGTEDFSITTQAAILESLDEIMRIVTLVAAGIAGISLVVGAMGILTMMWVSRGGTSIGSRLITGDRGQASADFSHLFSGVCDAGCAGRSSWGVLGNFWSLFFTTGPSRFVRLCR